MELAILSMQKIINYGSVLQAYSLKHIMEDITSEEVKFIDIDENTTVPVNMPIKDTDDYAVSRKIGMVEKVKKYLMFQDQKKKTFPLICKFMDEELPTDNENNYDLVVVGSDEVFKAIDNIRLQLYGQVPNAKKVVTYAASCGSASITGIGPAELPTVKKAVNNFSKMSVRDAGTYEYMSQLYDGEIVYNLDPVLMGDLYKRQHKPVKLKNYMIIYAYNNRFRDEHEVKAIKDFAKARNLTTVCFGGVLSWCDKFIPATPFELLDYFYYADYIVTDTFHGSIFSIINHKKFVSFIRPTNANKLGDLLKRLGLNDRLVNSYTELEEKLEKDIDYNSVDKVLEEERVKTRQYLTECING